MKAIIYARCSTDESRQDVEVQLKQLMEYCQKEGWEFEEKFEYASGSKGIPPVLNEIMDLIAKRTYQVMIVHNLDRFSRLSPKITEQMLNFIVDCKCRFIALQNNLDSENQMGWYAMKGYFSYFANVYSVNLSKKIKLGMENAKLKGKPIGRPKGAVDKKERSKKGYYNRKRKFRPDWVGE
jgi:DNA invertase Pin-like site-specific DNA recombinase